MTLLAIHDPLKPLSLINDRVRASLRRLVQRGKHRFKGYRPLRQQLRKPGIRVVTDQDSKPAFFRGSQFGKKEWKAIRSVHNLNLYLPDEHATTSCWKPLNS